MGAVWVNCMGNCMGNCILQLYAVVKLPATQPFMELNSNMYS